MNFNKWTVSLAAIGLISLASVPAEARPKPDEPGLKPTDEQMRRILRARMDPFDPSGLPMAS